MLSLSCLAHVAGGGVLPGWPALALVGLLVFAECAVLTHWRLSPTAVLAVMAAGQLVLHEILMALASSPISMSTTQAVMGSASVSVSPTAGMTAGMRDGSIRMLAWHAVAATVLAFLLSFAEDVLWRLWCWFTPATARARMRSIVVPDQPARVRPDRTEVPPGLGVLLAMNPRRGPPACPSV